MPVFEVKSPDGRIVEVTAPEGATEQQAIQYAQDNWAALSAQSPKAETSLVTQITDPFKRALGAANEVAGAVVEPIVSMGTGAIAKPVSEIAGLAATGYEALKGGKDAQYIPEFQKSLREAMTYEPRTVSGRSQYNPLNAIPSAIGAGIEAISPSQAEDAATLSGAGQNILREAIPQAIGIGAAKLAPVVKQKLADTNLAKAAELQKQQAFDALRNTIRARGQNIGLIAPSDGGATLTISKIGGAEPHLSLKNREVATQKIAEDVGLPKGAISDTDITNRITELGKSYDVVEKALGKGVPIKLDFKKQVYDMLTPMKERFAQDPKAFAAYKPAIDLLEQQVAPIKNASGQMVKQEINPSIVMDKIRQFRKDARTYGKDTTGDPFKMELADTSFKLANLYENLMEDVLAKSGKKALLDKFRDSRKQLSQIHIIDSARMSDGLLDLQKLSSNIGKYGADKKFVDGNLKTVAEFANMFKNVTKPITKSDFATASRWETAGLVGGIAGAVPSGGTSLALAAPAFARTVVPTMAEKGMLQAKIPNYSLSAMRRVTPGAVGMLEYGAPVIPSLEEQQ